MERQATAGRRLVYSLQAGSQGQRLHGGRGQMGGLTTDYWRAAGARATSARISGREPATHVVNDQYSLNDIHAISTMRS